MFVIKLLINIALMLAGLFVAFKLSEHSVKFISMGTMAVGIAKIMSFVVVLGLIQYLCLWMFW
ncbi:MAG: hypothetical protein HON94_12400 [Methylococcales bacterium]|jgi:hypothetical protein|nr:hypothetical protein [Methylococcales bacterium]MBT7409670.1 hypothetical protein [Methylococcales bacterium]